ncbi:MAG TPA: hypothetical protein VK528_03375 [Flavobacterium sp.]|nr:hypothetical protein [Flavobacterium sp.]
MKKLLLFLLLLGANAFAQQFIQKKDGTKIIVADGSIHIEPSSKRIGYLLKDDQKEYHVKFKELDFASYGETLFKAFTVEKKTKGFYVIAENNGKTLVLNKQKRVKSRGGFESSYVHYELGVLDAAGNYAGEILSFTNETSNTSAETRSKIIPMVKAQLADCPKLLEKIVLFESPPSDTKNTMILVFLDTPVLVKCN